ncbi:uncharacterized protein LOC134261069 [Saccostrea cucullata]|uniref:uncharacterized protein LOC134261069 n=1 Tax=Saccostrea cuccullata TaxID=36930 RepID=UPI002ED4B7C0
MSLIGLLIYLRSWFSKSPDCFPSSGRLSTEVTESQRDRYESHGSTSSVGADHVVSSPRDQPDLNTYTDLRFSRMYDSSHDCGGGPQPTAPSVDSIPTQGCKDQNDKEVKGIDDDDDDNDDDGDVDDDGDGVDDDDVDDNNEVDDDAACKRK